MPTGQFTATDVDPTGQFSLAPDGSILPWEMTSDAAIVRARSKYKFIDKLGVAMLPSSKKGGEGWPAGEPGSPDAPRPKEIPIDKHGIEVGPGSSEDDIAGEVLHVDPFANQIRQRMTQSLRPDQVEFLKKEALDYGDDKDPDVGTPEHGMDNAVDSAIRGHLVGQWPKSANDAMKYSPEQMDMLNQLGSYMKSGQMPTDMAAQQPVQPPPSSPGQAPQQ